MLFGTTAPKFVYGGTTVTMDYTIITKNEAIRDSILHQSIINGHTEEIIRGKHWLYELQMYLFRVSTDEYTIAAKYAEMKKYEGLDVKLYRHSDGGTFKSSINIVFTVSGMTVDQTAGAVYSNNGSNYQVVSTSLSAHAGTITCKKISGNARQLPSGTLTKVSGTGDASVTYSAATGSDVLFTLSYCNESYLETSQYRDLLTIGFTSKDYVDLAANTFTP